MDNNLTDTSKIRFKYNKLIYPSFSFEDIWLSVAWILVKKLMFVRIRCRMFWSGLNQARAETQLINNKVCTVDYWVEWPFMNECYWWIQEQSWMCLKLIRKYIT